ncbi:Tecrl [Acrasis kona]|uniref:Tecrl n=1 Tax=Acrasis kona TaxID=1008807 RepID=A0AAW2YKX0_9EUKA
MNETSVDGVLCRIIDVKKKDRGYGTNQSKIVRVVVLSDTHNYHDKIKVPDGDVLIHCGDFTKYGAVHHATSFARYFSAQMHPHKIVVLGNHEWWFSSLIKRIFSPEIHVLYDQSVEIFGITFYGSRFKSRYNIGCYTSSAKQEFNDIPHNTDVLITHQPPDNVGGLNVSLHNGKSVGNINMMERVLQVKPLVHVFGHNHNFNTPSFDQVEGCDTTFINCAIVVGKMSNGILRSPILFDLLARSDVA